MKRFDLGISLNYCGQWGICEAVREYFQNALDAETVSPDNKMYFDYDSDNLILRIGNKDGYLPTSSLLLGMTSKAFDEKTIGQHGEGYKVATVVLMRLGKGVKVYNRKEKEIWTARVVKSRRYQADVVVFDVEKVSMFKSVPNQDLIFEVSGVTHEEYKEIVESNLHLQELAEEDVLNAGKSRVLLADKYVGKIFVNGLFVCRSKMAQYGYDLEPSLVKLDRDRGLIDSFDLQFVCGKVLCATGDVDFIKDAKDTWDGEYIRFYIENSALSSHIEEVYDDECSAFYDKYGLDAIPTDDTDEFNRLKRNGYNPVMVSRNKKYYITSSSSYVSSDIKEEVPDPEELASKLDDWFKYYINEGTEAYENGASIVQSVLDFLRK